MSTLPIRAALVPRRANQDLGGEALVQGSLRSSVTLGVVATVLLAASPAALGADMPSRRHHHHDGGLAHAAVVRPVVPAPPSEYYERPLYEGPAFFYRPYYGSGPSLQWFDFGLGREKYE